MVLSSNIRSGGSCMGRGILYGAAAQLVAIAIQPAMRKFCQRLLVWSASALDPQRKFPRTHLRVAQLLRRHVAIASPTRPASGQVRAKRRRRWSVRCSRMSRDNVKRHAPGRTTSVSLSPRSKVRQSIFMRRLPRRRTDGESDKTAGDAAFVGPHVVSQRDGQSGAPRAPYCRVWLMLSVRHAIPKTHRSQKPRSGPSESA